MANDLTINPVIVNTCGVLWTTPVRIQKATLVLSAEADTAVFVSWDASKTKHATQTNKTTTVTSSKTATSTGNFEAAEVTAGDIIKITNSSTGNNLGTFIVDSRDSDDAITIETGNTLTDEANKVYSWWTLTPSVCFTLKAPETEKMIVSLDWPEGTWFPNLALQSLSTSAVVYLYV